MARVERPTCFFYVSASLFLEFQWCSRIGPPLYVEKERKMEMVLCRERKRDKGTSILFYGLHDIKLNGLLLYREKKIANELTAVWFHKHISLILLNIASYLFDNKT